MKDKIKFVHCADIHLGANPFSIEERFEDMGKAFEQVCDFAVKEQVDFLLISGDFFHNKVLNPKTLEQAINILEKLKMANIPVFLTEGNHDMETYSNVYSWLQFLSSRKYIYLLRTRKSENENILKIWNGQEGAIYQTENFDIIGLGYPGSTAAKYIEKVDVELEDLINNKRLGDKPIICMLHTGIDRFLTESMGGLKENEIDSIINKVDYLALGHIHTRYENTEKKYFNPGSIECVRITDNAFNKGFYFVIIDTKTKKLQHEFKIVQTRNSLALEINIDKYNEEEYKDKIIEKVKEEYAKNCLIDSKIMLQLKIIGSAKKGTKNLDINELKNQIANEIPILHQEIINLIKYVDDKDIIISNDISREEIDKIVLLDKISKVGFDSTKEASVYSLIEKLMEYGHDNEIDIESNQGEEIEKMLFGLIE